MRRIIAEQQREEDDFLQDFLNELVSGDELYMLELEFFQKSTEMRIASNMNQCPHILEEWTSQSGRIKRRQEIINAIMRRLRSQESWTNYEKMPLEHYEIYFHALAVLKVEKDEIRVSENDYLFNAFLYLWQLDDGSRDALRVLKRASDFLSYYIEELLNRRGRVF